MVSLFGVEPGAHHTLNLVLHGVNAMLVAVWLGRATRSRWLGLGVATCFAVHPIHVESVAWITERKDVLSMSFCLLALLAHERRARGGGWGSLGLMFLFHALAVMAKPLAVTLPCAMLLLDAWPYGHRKWIGRVLEKMPMGITSAVASSLTLRCQQAADAIASMENLPLFGRVVNAVDSYGTYVRRAFLPDDLIPHYPYPEAPPVLSSLVALGLGIAWAVMAWRWRRLLPALGIGGLWFLGTLVPMIGLVQAGGAAMADRYAYLPFLGLYLALASGFAVAWRRWPEARPFLAGGLGCAGILLAAAGRRQVRIWRDSESLFRHTLSLSPKNSLAHNNLGLALVDRGRTEEARWHYLAALEARPGYVQASNNLGILEVSAGRPAEAAKWFESVVLRDPGHVIAWHNLAKVRAQLGFAEAARVAFRRSIEGKPDFVMPRYDLAGLEVAEGRWTAALAELDALLEIAPDHADAWVNRGYVLGELGRPAEAESAYLRAVALGSQQAASNLEGLREQQQLRSHWRQRAAASQDPEELRALAGSLRDVGAFDEARSALERALAQRPDWADALNDLGVVLVRLGEHDRAVEHFEAALRRKPDHPEARRNLQQATGGPRSDAAPPE
jgi:tetratricopeptide (TPR) repeat protein